MRSRPGEVKPPCAPFAQPTASLAARRRLPTVPAAASFGEAYGGPHTVLTILFELADVVLRLYLWAVILAAVVTTLVSFGVLDTRNRLVWTIGDFLYRITEPALRPIRNILPNFGGIDLSPLVLILVIMAVRMLLARIFAGLVTGLWGPVLL
jgi:YggT family protein